MAGNLSKDAIIRQLVAMKVPRDQAERTADRTLATYTDYNGGSRTRSAGGAGSSHARVARTLGDPESAFDLRDGTLRAVLFIAPRTKKNHLRWFGLQSIAYTNYRDWIIDQVARASDPMFPNPLQIPLPDRPYNLAATFYVDHHGKPADRFGLEQGLADALENAGVVSNDWYFRTGDGTRIVAGDPRPRVEFIISPNEEIAP